MKIYLDNSVFSIQRVGGVSVYWYELVKRFMGSELDVTYINANLKSNNIFESKLPYDPSQIVNENTVPMGLLRYLPLTKKLPNYSIFHSGYLRVATQKSVVNIITIHDFAHDFGLASSFPRNQFNIWQKGLGIKYADGIICISENTKKDLIHLYPSMEDKNIKVIYHGINDSFLNLKNKQFDTLKELGIPTGKLIIFIGERKAYKNFKLAVEILALLENEYKLIIVGGNFLSTEEIEFLNNKISGRYFKLSNISIEVLNILYNNAFCLLYPSIYEGFGYPPLEAMQAGCPVVTTDKASIPEVVGNGGIMVSDANPYSFVEKIRLLENNISKNNLITNGFIQSKRFNLDKCFQETTNFYTDCLEKKRKSTK